jgi:hypothetical protein
MTFLRIGSPLSANHPIDFWNGKTEGYHMPPFVGGTYAFVPKFIDIWTMTGPEAVLKHGCYVFDYAGPVWAHNTFENDGYIRFGGVLDGRWVKYPTAHAFEKVVETWDPCVSKMDKEVILLPASVGGVYADIISGNDLFPWDELGYEIHFGVIYAPDGGRVGKI